MPYADAHENGASCIRSAAIGAGLISAVVNILALTAPLFMLEVYDRVLSSRSLPTLAGLAILAAALLSFQAILDVIRSRILLRIGERLDDEFSTDIYKAIVRLPLVSPLQGDGLQPLRDLDNVRSYLSGQGPTALFDLPWTPFYLGICFLFHFWLGLTAAVGAALLTIVTLLTHRLSARATREAMAMGIRRNSLTESARRNAEVVHAMGLGGRLLENWKIENARYLTAHRKAGDVTGGFGGVAKALRVMVQSAVLGMGALLVIRQEATPGVMIAASIIMGRGLAPVDLAIANWRPLLMARQSWRRIRELLRQTNVPDVKTTLPAPRAELRSEGLAVIPPGCKKPTITGIEFKVTAGTIMGIIGPSGSGKSTLARTLVGVWSPAAGAVRVDGASLDQWAGSALGQHIGFLPQDASLFAGTIAENISRFDQQPNAEPVIAAAKAAGVHDLILKFEQGYDTPIGEGGLALSSGQRQRIGLARALYRDPFLVVLDEPNAHLDADGESSLLKAVGSIRDRGGIAVIVTHRSGAISVVDQVLIMEAGRMKAFGPRDEVLGKVLKMPRRMAGSGEFGARPASAPSGRLIMPMHVPVRTPAGEATSEMSG